MDFASLGRTIVTSEGVKMHLVGPDGSTPLYAYRGEDGAWLLTYDADKDGARPCQFTVISTDSKTHRRRKHQLIDALRQRQKNIKSEQVELEAMRVVAGTVIGWENIPWDGQLLEFTDENLLKFLDLCAWNYEQLNTFAGERSNFLPKGTLT